MLFLIYCVHVGVMWTPRNNDTKNITVFSAQDVFNVKKDIELLSFDGGRGGMTQT